MSAIDTLGYSKASFHYPAVNVSAGIDNRCQAKIADDTPFDIDRTSSDMVDPETSLPTSIQMTYAACAIKSQLPVDFLHGSHYPEERLAVDPSPVLRNPYRFRPRIEGAFPQVPFLPAKRPVKASSFASAYNLGQSPIHHRSLHSQHLCKVSPELVRCSLVHVGYPSDMDRIHCNPNFLESTPSNLILKKSGPIQFTYRDSDPNFH